MKTIEKFYNSLEKENIENIRLINFGLIDNYKKIKLAYEIYNSIGYINEEIKNLIVAEIDNEWSKIFFKSNYEEE